MTNKERMDFVRRWAERIRLELETEGVNKINLENILDAMLWVYDDMTENDES